MRSVNRMSGARSMKARRKLRESVPGIENLEARRLLASAGDLDLAFNLTGWATVSAAGSSETYGHAVAVDDQDRVIVAGEGRFGFSLFVARLLEDGTPDPTFGTGGVVTTNLGGTDPLATDVVFHNGDIYVTGTYLATAPDTDFFVLRLDDSGATTGSLLLDVAGDQTGGEMHIDPLSGDIYVAGNNQGNAMVAKITPGLLLDTTYGMSDLDGVDGFATLAAWGGADVTGIAQQTDGKIVIGGSNSGSNGPGILGRLELDGDADLTYGTADTFVDGLALPSLDAGSTIDHIAIDSADNVYAVGSDFSFGTATLRKFNASGVELSDAVAGGPGLGFATDGGATLEVPGTFFAGLGLTLDGTGSVVIAGQLFDGALFKAFVSRFDQSTGALDLDFGIAGLATTVADGFAGAAEVAVDGDGNIVIGGVASTTALAARFLGQDEVVVTPVFVDINGNLVIPGTGGNDAFEVIAAGGGQVQVIYNGDDAGDFTFGGVILINGEDGNDSIVIDPNVTIDAVISGGAGDDTILGGGGNDNIVGGSGGDILVGGAGGDTIEAGAGWDLLVGGDGADCIMGTAGEDILIASGLTDSSLANLSNIHSIWTSGGSYATRVDLLLSGSGPLSPGNFEADNDIDTLFGGASTDLFILNSGEDINDATRKET